MNTDGAVKDTDRWGPCHQAAASSSVSIPGSSVFTRGFNSPMPTGDTLGQASQAGGRRTSCRTRWVAECGFLGLCARSAAGGLVLEKMRIRGLARVLRLEVHGVDSGTCGSGVLRGCCRALARRADALAQPRLGHGEDGLPQVGAEAVWLHDFVVWVSGGAVGRDGPAGRLRSKLVNLRVKYVDIYDSYN
jgi:hypothetical protein